MELIDCARCGRHVTSEAPRCPECGADPRTGIATFKRGEMDRVRICQGVRIRCLAIFIDFLVIAAVTLVASLLVYLVLLGGGSFAEVGKGPSSWPLWVAACLGAFAYFWWSEAAWGRTLGKRLCDLRVVRRDGARLGSGGAFVRNLLRVVDWLPLFYVLGAAVIWATPKNQRIGDLAARSAVVRTKLVTVSRLDDATLPVVPWSTVTSSRRAP
ncbi:MAG: RDD family protein [Actinobacteria bacterium]|nr:RDD family protein [Actinomycetota bacterium]